MIASSSRQLKTLILGLVSGALITQLVHLLAGQNFPGKPLISAGVQLSDTRYGVTETDRKLENQLLQTRPKECRSDLADLNGITVADQLFNRVRILCLIMSHPKNYGTKATAVNNTWARRCNRYTFFGGEPTRLNIPLVVLNIKESRKNLWKKTWMSMDYVEKHFNLDEFDFLIKVDDDAYILMENLRYLLLPLDPNEPTLIGRVFWPRNWPYAYTSGGAGYLLSRRAAKTFVQKGIRWYSQKNDSNDSKLGMDPCDLQSTWPEDVKMGHCLMKLGARLVDSRDQFGLERFHPLGVDYAIGLRRSLDWMISYNYHKFNTCIKGCVSDTSVSFHYLSPDELYTFEFLLYNLRPIGRIIDQVALKAHAALVAQDLPAMLTRHTN